METNKLYLKYLCEKQFKVFDLTQKERSRNLNDSRYSFVYCMTELFRGMSPSDIMPLVDRHRTLYYHAMESAKTYLISDVDCILKIYREFWHATDDEEQVKEFGLWYSNIKAKKRGLEFDAITEVKKEVKESSLKCVKTWRHKNPIKAKFFSLRDTAKRSGIYFELDLKSFSDFCKEKNYIETKKTYKRTQIRLKDKYFGYAIDNLKIVRA